MEEHSLMQKKIMNNGEIPQPEALTKAMGISEERKKNILKLVEGPDRIIPESRVKFWEEMPTF